MPGPDHSPPAPVISGGPLTPADASAVRTLASAAAEADGVAPLSEQVLLQLQHGSAQTGPAHARDLLLTADGTLCGYAYLDSTDDLSSADDPASTDVPSGTDVPASTGSGAAGHTGEVTAELVIHPARRGQGLGLLLLRALAGEAGGGHLQVWAHGDLPAAARLAARAGLGRVRSLWQMRRTLQGELDSVRVPDGITVRTFQPGRDEDEWVAVNARAFAAHPEQGSWTRDDLDLREAEPWFDPGGFFLAERGGQLAGFHWTKVHTQPETIGEVYVVGVDPGQQAGGLGRALTLTGLHHLRSRGLPAVMLYVDESNRPAVRMYESLGFAHTGTDVMYARPGHQ